MTKGKAFWLLSGLLAAAALISCATVTRTVLAPPQIPGATFIGSEACAECHENINKHFSSATHANLRAEGPNAANVGCESCHGAGSIHRESGGARDTIINPKKSPETCFQCHLDKRGQFSMAFHHPLEDGKVGCSDCHNPHTGPAIKGGGTALGTPSETCFKCHSAQRGPFVFEHEALREGCTSCHNPHGSMNQKMLTSRNQDLCLKCHFQQQIIPGQINISLQNHSGFLPQGTCWSAGCHEAVHGSQVNPHLRF
jgi:predicted CXXCH cytochrome family protein